MKTARLARLAALTQGAAVLGALGPAIGGCDKTAAPPPEPIHVNAMPTPPSSAPAAGDVGDSGLEGGLRRFPILNAPAGRRPPPADGDSTK